MPLFSRPLLASLWLCLTLGTAPLSANAAPEAARTASAVALDIAAAAQWRIQGQRQAKLFLQGGLKLDADKATRRLADSRSLTDDETARLAIYASQRSHTRCQQLWAELQGEVRRPYSRAQQERVEQLADELMLHAGKLSVQIEGGTTTPVGRLLDLTGRLNMLAQRLARLYLSALDNNNSESRRVDIEQTQKEFTTGLSLLEQAPENTPATREALSLARMQWVFFDAALRDMNQRRNDPRTPMNVVTTSERIGESLAAVATIYLRDMSAARTAR